MDKLFLVTENGNIPIEQSFIKKYSLKKGMKSPFTNNLIVDIKGDSKPEINEDKPMEQDASGDQILSTAEAIDLAQGADSY